MPNGPLELGTTWVGAEPDPIRTLIGGGGDIPRDSFERVLAIQRTREKQISGLIAESVEKFNSQHQKNMENIDSDIDNQIKNEGGSNGSIDASALGKTITKEKNILSKLYRINQEKSDSRAQQSKALFPSGIDLGKAYRSGDYENIYRPDGTYTKRGWNDIASTWAPAYEAALLAQVYAETARRMQVREQYLTIIEASKAELDLNNAKEQVRLKQYPDAPSGVSLDLNLLESKAQKEYFSTGGTGFLFSWFYSKVRNSGDWDYKKGQSQYESFGNFHYGAVGTAAGFSEAVLLRAAGAAQSLAGTSTEEFGRWWAEAPYGDDPVDQVWIKAGIDYAKSKGY